MNTFIFSFGLTCSTVLRRGSKIPVVIFSLKYVTQLFKHRKGRRFKSDVKVIWFYVLVSEVPMENGGWR